MKIHDCKIGRMVSRNEIGGPSDELGRVVGYGLNAYGEYIVFVKWAYCNKETLNPAEHGPEAVHPDDIRPFEWE